MKFANWTDEGYLRAPVYLGLRDDVAAADVRREDAPAPSEVPRSSPAAARASPRLKRPSSPPDEPAGASDRARLIAAIDELARRGSSGRLTLPDGAAIDLGNLGKPLWPELGLTKADLFRYYVAVSPYLLPVVLDRPLVMRRFPDGVDGPAFYQHRAPEQPPRGVRVEGIEGDDVPSRFVGGSLATLLYMTQLASISQDPWFSRIGSPLEMDFAAIDLDPMDAAPFSRVRDVARWVGDELDALGVTGYLKTSGATGLHIYLPMRPGTPFEAGMLFCRIVAELVAARHPDDATVERAVKKRDPTGRVRRLPAERRGQDARLRLQRARERLRGRLDAARLGRAGRRPRPARVHDPHPPGAAAAGRRSVGAPPRVAGDRPRGGARAGPGPPRQAEVTAKASVASGAPRW